MIHDSWEAYLQPIKDLVKQELDKERAAYESARNQLLIENAELQRRLTSVLQEISELKQRQPVVPTVAKGSPNTMAKEILALKSSDAILKVMKTIVGPQVPLGPQDCPDFKKNVPDTQKLWHTLGMSVLDQMTYVGMRNILFWIIIVARQPIDNVGVEIMRLRKFETSDASKKRRLEN